MKLKTLSKVATGFMFWSVILIGGAFAGCYSWEDNMEEAPALEVCLDGACINVLQWYDCGNMSGHSAGFTETENFREVLSVSCEVKSQGSGYDGFSHPSNCTVYLGGMPLSSRIKEQYLTCKYLNREEGPNQCHWFE